MFQKISILILAFSVVFPSVQAAGKVESLEEGIERLAIDIFSQMKAKGVKKIAINNSPV